MLLFPCHENASFRGFQGTFLLPKIFDEKEKYLKNISNVHVLESRFKSLFENPVRTFKSFIDLIPYRSFKLRRVCM
jgi:hypothetical protein